jgi:hypothetical protein
MASEIWKLDGVLDALEKVHRNMPDRSFAFVLGAGASISSGIPGAQALAERWLHVLHKRACMDNCDVAAWLQTDPLDSFGKLNLQNAAEFYPKIFERCFGRDPEAGYAELEDTMEGKTPGLGYSLLAEILQGTRHKVVVTTNFDNLVADALAMHAHKSPLIAGHEALAGFVRPFARRPLVAKIHRDLLLTPINHEAGVSELAEAWRNALSKLFKYYTPIVIGYGGNDGSLMGLLSKLEKGDIAGRPIWCFREEPPQKVIDVLDKHDGIRVKIAGFDELMIHLSKRLIADLDIVAIGERIKDQGKLRAEKYHQEREKFYSVSIVGGAEQKEAGKVLSGLVIKTDSWFAWQMKVIAATSMTERRSIYEEGIKHFPKSAGLIGNYAGFARYELNDYPLAEHLYQKSLSLDPTNAINHGNYASFLFEIKHDDSEAVSMYEKAIKLAPDFVGTQANFASLLLSRGLPDDLDRAKRFIDSVLSAKEQSHSQQIAEVLLYQSLHAELTQSDITEPLRNLKHQLKLNFPRQHWLFTRLLSEVLPKIPKERQQMYSLLADAILSEDKVGVLEDYTYWQNL